MSKQGEQTFAGTGSCCLAPFPSQTMVDQTCQQFKKCQQEHPQVQPKILLTPRGSPIITVTDCMEQRQTLPFAKAIVWKRQDFQSLKKKTREQDCTLVVMQ